MRNGRSIIHCIMYMEIDLMPEKPEIKCKNSAEKLYMSMMNCSGKNSVGKSSKLLAIITISATRYSARSNLISDAEFS